MINPYCFLPFHVYQVSSGLERRGFTFQGDIRGKDWEIQAGKAYYAVFTWFCKANIRLVCNDWAERDGKDVTRKKQKQKYERDSCTLQQAEKNPLHWQAKQKISAGIMQ